MYAALSGSVLFSLSPDAQRPKVLLYLLVSVAPFAVVAPLIGPTVDRIPGGRRFVMQITAVGRAVIYLLMASHVDDLFLYPAVFGAMVLSKTYTVSKSALVPMVVRTDEELVEANSKLGLIAAVVGGIIFVPLAGLAKVEPTFALVPGAVLFLVAAISARRLPRDAVAVAPPQRQEREELHSVGIVRATAGMTMIRAAIGFLFFQLFFWLNEDYGLAAFGLAAAASTIGSMVGNIAAPRLRQRVREEVMLVAALSSIAVAGTLAALFGGLITAVLVAAVVNLASSIGRMAFDSIVQRDAPDANQGRAFARFETRFQLAWVVAGLPAVLFTLPHQIGFLVVALIGAVGAASYMLSLRAISRGEPMPPSLSLSLRRRLRSTSDRRRASHPESQHGKPGSALPPPRPSDKPR